MTPGGCFRRKTSLQQRDSPLSSQRRVKRSIWPAITEAGLRNIECNDPIQLAIGIGSGSGPSDAYRCPSCSVDDERDRAQFDCLMGAKITGIELDVLNALGDGADLPRTA